MLYKSACQQQERLSVVQVSMSATGEAKSVVQVSMSQQERLSVVQVSMSATGGAKSVVQVSMSATGEAKCCTSQHVSNRIG